MLWWAGDDESATSGTVHPCPESPAATVVEAPQAPPPWWRQHLWRHAPSVLLQHASAFTALALAGFLVTLAAASAPFVTTASASSALKEKLSALSPLTTGLEISGQASGGRPTRTLLTNDDRRRAAVAGLQLALGLQPAVFTLESNTPLIVNSPRGSAQVLLMARTGALAHTTRLRSVPGDGVWIADLTASSLGLAPGGFLPLEYGERGGPSHIARLRIKGIYRALDSSAPSAYWANFLPEILPPGVDPPPPARYVLMSRAQILALAHRLGGGRVVNYEGQVFRLGSGFSLLTKAELAVDPHGLTLAQARRLDHRFAAVRSSLAGSALAQRLGCVVPRSGASRSVVGASRSSCHVSSSLSSAVALADSSAASISPAVSLLSDAAAVIALAVAAAAGLFLVRRRRSETALMFARGESTSAFACRTGLEMLLPVLLGGAVGFGIAVAFAGAFAPAGSTDSGTVRVGLAHGGGALAAALAVAVLVACAAFARQFDSGRRVPRWLRLIPWELPLLAVGLWLLIDVSTGGGLVTNAKTGTSHPTLAVFVAPLLLAAAAAGAVARGARRLLRRSTGRAASRSTVAFLVMRRLAAARGTP